MAAVGQQRRTYEQYPSKRRRYVNTVYPSLSLLVGLSSGKVRRDGGDTRSLPPSRRLSTYRRGSGELNVHFSSLLQLMSETGDTCPTSVLASFVEDPDRHLGQRATSPERQFKCEGWCRDEIPSEASLEHPDVVCWTFSPLSIPSYLLPYFFS